MAKLAVAFIFVVILQTAISFNPLASRVPTQFKIPHSTHVINFQTPQITLKGVCTDIMMYGKPGMLPDAMRDIAQFLKADPTRIANAGGDPNMNCLFQYGSRNGRDVANIISDYFDTIIEFPGFIPNPCENVQCRGEESPFSLIRQAHQSWLQRSRAMGFGRQGMMNRGNMAGMMGGGMNIVGGAPRVSGLMTGTNPIVPAARPNNMGNMGAVPGMTQSGLPSRTIPAAGNPAQHPKPATGNFGSSPSQNSAIAPSTAPGLPPTGNVAPTANVQPANTGTGLNPSGWQQTNAGAPAGNLATNMNSPVAPTQTGPSNDPFAALLQNPQVMQMIQQMVQQLFGNMMGQQSNAGGRGFNMFGQMPGMAQLLRG